MNVRSSVLPKSRTVGAPAILRLLYCLIATLLLGGSLQAQTEELVVGAPPYYLVNIPIDRYYNYSTNEMIYTASEIGMAGNITNLAFFRVMGSNYDPINSVSIYMKHTSDSEMEQGTYSLDGYTLVYQGNFPNDADEDWMDVDLIEPFTYNGTDNLQVLIVKGYQDWIDEGEYPLYVVGVTDISMARSRSNDNFQPSALLPTMIYVYDEETEEEFEFHARAVIKLMIDPPPPMTFNSTTAFQITGDVKRGSENNAILRAVVDMDGLVDPLWANSFTFSTAGSSNPGILSNARLWYTGANTEFHPEKAVQLGATIETVGSTFTFEGDQELGTGENNFWLTFDVAKDANFGDVIDARFLSAVIDGTNRTPTTTNPAGNRVVQLVYCTPTYESDCSGDYIDYLGFGDFDNDAIVNFGSGCNGQENNYVHYPTDEFTTTVIAGREYGLEIQPGPDWNEGFGVWIDFNQNDSFDDPGEAVYIAPFSTRELITATVSIPLDAMMGNTRMRVRAVYSETEDNPVTAQDACTHFEYGETEDYNIQIRLPGKVEITGNTAFGNVGREVRRTVTLYNPSDIEIVNFSGWTVSGSSGFKVYQAGTTTPLPQGFTLGLQQSMNVDVVFGTQGSTPAGQQNATLTLFHSGVNAPNAISLSGSYASITAADGATNLLAPGAKFNVGGLQPGAGQISKEFRLGSNMPLTVSAPIMISSYTLTGPDAALFGVSTLPAGITSENLISVTLREIGATPGPKSATLTINHSGANGPVTVIQLEGRVGQPIIDAPTLVMLPPVALGQTYASPYDNVRLIPITRAGGVDIQLFQTPQLTGSGASRMELVSNTGLFFIRGKYAVDGSVIVAGDGDIANASNWLHPVLEPIIATETRPLLLAVRMKPAPSGTPAGSYDASMLLSNGSGIGISNAVNVLNIAIVGEVLNDPERLALYPGQIAFGSVPVATSSMRTLTLRNQSGVAGMAMLTITGNDYTFSNGQRSITVDLPADNSASSVEVRFSPMSSGSSNGLITASGVISGTVALSGTGQAANPGNLLVLVDGQTPGSIVNFGNVAVGQTGSKTVTVVNNNVGPVTISSIGRSGANATQFSVVDPMTWEIPGNGGSVSFVMKFQPTSVSNPQKDGMVTIYNSTGVPKSLNVRGTAVLSGGGTVSVTLSPSTYNFGNQTGTHSFVLSNNGGSAITVSGALILGSENFVVMDAASSFPRTVNAGGTTTITVKFTAQGVNGLRSGSLVVITPSVSPYPTSSLMGRVGTAAFGGNGGVQGQTAVTGESGITYIDSYPNPVEGVATVRYELSEAQRVTIRLYDELGHEVLTIPAVDQPAGEQNVQMDVSNHPAGRYYIRIEGSYGRAEGRIVKVK